MAKFWSKHKPVQVAEQVGHLTKRVYLLECEAGTQEGRDIRDPAKDKCYVVPRPVPSSPVIKVTVQYLEGLQQRNKDLVKETWEKFDEIKKLKAQVEKTVAVHKRQYATIGSLQERLANSCRDLKETRLERDHMMRKNARQETTIRDQGEKRMRQADRIVGLEHRIRDLVGKPPRPCQAHPCGLCSPERKIPGAYYRICECGHGVVLV